MKKQLLLFLLLTCSISTITLAQSKTDCANATTQLELNKCAQQEYLSVDKMLNTTYKKVLAKISTKQKATFVQSQRTWIIYRDQYAAVYASLFKGGSMAASAVLNCKTETTRARTTELEQLLEQVSL